MRSVAPTQEPLPGGVIKAFFPGESMWVKLERPRDDGSWEARLQNNPVVLAARHGDLVIVTKDARGWWNGMVTPA